ncbi:beta-N-acetylhexosaminidase [Microbacterium mangrovi]|uniref:beta-N-acetylhexosaminidase n=1 Tax=Microbacterium mangrovi TaxID=1348253 RepID=A0A0B2A0Y4_9MICO|nr:glycoside hydrolase family 3 N-terminal domain-containing protein [Microbacterium mangrovi]KHK97135.1 beta-N-acetylhexosaminidase [Microbacterium mangrovi]
MRAVTRLRSAAALAVLAVALTGCTGTPASQASGTHSATASATPSPTPTPTPTPTPADPIADLSLAQRVGQLFMVGTVLPNADAATVAAITDRHVGNVFLHGRSSAGATAIAALTARFRALVSRASTGGIPLWISTDQEGGTVQVLSGPGFDQIPSALMQGRMPSAQLRSDAAEWARQLKDAGVNMNLAPVADIVTSPATASQNPPIGQLNREYGFDQASVAVGAGNFADGMRAGSVMPVFKHFPGLGRVTANTDFSAHVVDTVIGPDSPDVRVYWSVLAQGPACVMVSSAYYDRIDPSTPAVFSPKVVQNLLRDQVGFDGVVMTDDVSAAVAVKAWTPAERAVKAIQAGVDIVLVASDPSVLAPMYDAVLAKAKSDPAFAAEVDAAARRVVAAKAAQGVVPVP